MIEGVVGAYATVENSTRIGHESIVGHSAKIVENCTINGEVNYGVHIGKLSVVKLKASIDHSCRIGEHCLIEGEIGNSVTVENSTKIGPKANISESANIGEN